MSDIEALSKEIHILSLAISSLSSKRKALEEKRRETCQHTEVSHTTKYNHGGYDHTDYTDHTWTCKCCGLSETKREQGSSFA